MRAVKWEERAELIYSEYVVSLMEKWRSSRPCSGEQNQRFMHNGQLSFPRSHAAHCAQSMCERVLFYTQITHWNSGWPNSKVYADQKWNPNLCRHTPIHRRSPISADSVTTVSVLRGFTVAQKYEAENSKNRRLRSFKLGTTLTSLK